MSAAVSPTPLGLLPILALAMAICVSTGLADEGRQTWQQCVACHQPDAAGIPGVFPPLKGRLAQMIRSAEGREYVVRVLSAGLVGTISIDGQSYVGAMPALALSDGQIADVVDYIVNALGESAANTGENALSPAEVAAIRSRFAGGSEPSALELRSKVPSLNAP